MYCLTLFLSLHSARKSLYFIPVTVLFNLQTSDATDAFRPSLFHLEIEKLSGFECHRESPLPRSPRGHDVPHWSVQLRQTRLRKKNAKSGSMSRLGITDYRTRARSKVWVSRMRWPTLNSLHHSARQVTRSTKVPARASHRNSNAAS